MATPGGTPRRTARPRAYATSRGLDRVVFFTDAISAIAITLLILPLVDLVPDSSTDGSTAGQFLLENSDELLGFGISFAVIARLWYAHHQIFEHVVKYTSLLAWLSVAWAFTIVVLPLPTAITAEFPPTPFTVGLYIGTMFVSSAILTGISWLIKGNPDIEAPDNPVSRRGFTGSVTTTALFAVAFLGGTLVPGVDYAALLLLLLAGPIGALLSRRRKNDVG